MAQFVLLSERPRNRLELRCQTLPFTRLNLGKVSQPRIVTKGSVSTTNR